MPWSDETWGAARAIDAPPARPELVIELPVRPLEAPALTVAVPMPRLRAVEPVAGADDLDGAWRRRLERWAEVRESLDRLPAESWPRTSPAWSDVGDARAPVEAGSAGGGAGGGAWSRLDLGVRGAVASARPRRVVVRGGRRAGKSSNLCELAVADATSGTWGISAGDCGLPDRLVSLARLDTLPAMP